MLRLFSFFIVSKKIILSMLKRSIGTESGGKRHEVKFFGYLSKLCLNYLFFPLLIYSCGIRLDFEQGTVPPDPPRVSRTSLINSFDQNILELEGYCEFQEKNTVTIYKGEEVFTVECKDNSTWNSLIPLKEADFFESDFSLEIKDKKSEISFRPDLPTPPNLNFPEGNEGPSITLDFDPDSVESASRQEGVIISGTCSDDVDTIKSSGEGIQTVKTTCVNGAFEFSVRKNHNSSFLDKVQFDILTKSGFKWRLPKSEYRFKISAKSSISTMETEEWNTGSLSVDLNNDGLLDLVYASYNTSRIVTYFAQDSSTFADRTVYSDSNSLVDLNSTDINGDGFVDILYLQNTTSGPYNFKYMLNDGLGALLSPISISLSSSPTEICLGDFDSDGINDVVIGTLSGASLLLGTGSGFSSPSGIGAVALSQARSVECADINLDGDLDLVVSSWVGTGMNTGGVQVLLGDGTGGFSSLYTSSSADAALRFPRIKVEDIDGDGWPDLMGYISECVKWNINPGLAGFSDGGWQSECVRLIDLTGTPTRSSGYATAWAYHAGKPALFDLNNDGYKDFVAREWSYGSIFVAFGGSGGFSDPFFKIPHTLTGFSVAGTVSPSSRISAGNNQELILGNQKDRIIFLHLSSSQNRSAIAKSNHLDDTYIYFAKPLPLSDKGKPMLYEVRSGNIYSWSKNANDEEELKVIADESGSCSVKGIFPIGQGEVNKLLIHCSGEENTRVYGLNQSTKEVEIEALLNCQGIFQSGDLNADGLTDLVCFDSNQYITFKNNGFGNFSRSVLTTTVHAISAFAIVDLDRDGNLDVGSYSSSDNVVELHLVDESFSLKESEELSVSTDTQNLATANLSSSLLPELYLFNSTSNEIHEINYSEGSFSLDKKADLVMDSAPTVSDIDEDGKHELWVSRSEKLFLYEWSQDSDIFSTSPSEFRDGTGGLTISDYTGDGIPEIWMQRYLFHESYKFVFRLERNLN